jgi:hypothetical protein
MLSCLLLASGLSAPLTGWTELAYTAGTDGSFTIYERSQDNNTQQIATIEEYMEYYDPRQECWESENRTVPSTAPDWRPIVASLYPETGPSEHWLGPAEEFDEAVPLPLGPGGHFHDKVYYARKSGAYNRWQWEGVYMGNQQTTTRRRDLFIEYWLDRDWVYYAGDLMGGGN